MHFLFENSPTANYCMTEVARTKSMWVEGISISLQKGKKNDKT